jgi:hypothetical protein
VGRPKRRAKIAEEKEESRLERETKEEERRIEQKKLNKS